MKNGKICVAVMSVGSGVGQSVITSLNLSRLPLYTIGFGMNPLAFGGYDCHEMDYVPLIYSDNYIDELIKKCKKNQVDIIIPGSDDEAMILAKNIKLFNVENIKMIVSSAELMTLVRDKEKMCIELSKIADIFVESYPLDQINDLLDKNIAKFPMIAKPRDGFASKGIEILLDRDDLSKVTPNHIIQELAIPNQGDPFREQYLRQISKRINPQISEISIQVVTDFSGIIKGKMMSYNKLKNGVPIELIPINNDYVWEEVNKILPELIRIGFRGPINIQGRMTDNGLKLYEINARFTGITGWRAIMGFNEVEFCLKEWLSINKGKNLLTLNNNKFGIRQTTDKAIMLQNNQEVHHLSSIINTNLIKEKTILITGSGGFLGQAIIQELVKSEYKIIAFDIEKGKIEKLYEEYKNIECVSQEDYNSGIFNLGNIDIILHCGFARPFCSNEQIADSLKFSSELFSSATLHQVPAIINISSQSVYGTKQKTKFSEKSSVMPETVYSQAKYASELMLQNCHYINKQIYTTSLRMSTLTGGQNGLIVEDFVSKFVLNAINNQPINIVDGTQRFERLDVKDAAKSICALLSTDYTTWENCYNVGNEQDYSILEIAEMVKKVGLKKFSLDIKINITADNIPISLGMNCDKFKKLTNWKFQYNLEDTIISLFEYLFK